MSTHICPNCGRSVTEMRGPLMSDGSMEPSLRRERRHLRLRGLRDRIRGIKRIPAPNDDLTTIDIDAAGLHGEQIICRRCNLVMPATMQAFAD